MNQERKCKKINRSPGDRRESPLRRFESELLGALPNKKLKMLEIRAEVKTLRNINTKEKV